MNDRPDDHVPDVKGLNGADDDEALRLLVEMAAAGDLSDSERAEVEALIDDKAHLRAEYDRLRRPAAVTTPDTGPTQTSTKGGGCLFGIIAFVVAAALVIVGAMVLRSGDDGDDDVDPISTVLNAPDNRVLDVEGPAELAEFGQLALIYADGDAVLLGEAIPTAGELVIVDGADETVITAFPAGDVRVYIADLDDDATYHLRPTSP